MPVDRFSNSFESQQPPRRFAENIYYGLGEIERGVDLPRVYPTLLPGQKDTKVKISTEERLGLEGWNPDEISGAKPGSILHHSNGEIYEVTAINNMTKRLDIKKKDGVDVEGLAIIAAPRNPNAHEYNYRLNDQNRNSKKIKVVDAAFKNSDPRTTEFISNVLKAIPSQCLQVFSEINIHTQNVNKDGSFRVEPSLFSGKGVINLYIDEALLFHDGEVIPTKEAIDALYHELGHAIVIFLKGSTHPGERWKKVMDASDNDVSLYAAKKRYPKKNKHAPADRGEIEDIAETFRLYFGADAAKNPKTQELRQFCNPRFEKLDEVMEDLSAIQKKGPVARLLTGSPKSLKK